MRASEASSALAVKQRDATSTEDLIFVLSNARGKVFGRSHLVFILHPPSRTISATATQHILVLLPPWWMEDVSFFSFGELFVCPTAINACISDDHPSSHTLYRHQLTRVRLCTVNSRGRRYATSRVMASRMLPADPPPAFLLFEVLHAPFMRQPDTISHLLAYYTHHKDTYAVCLYHVP